MKLWRTQSNASNSSTPQSQTKSGNRLSRFLSANRSKVDVPDSPSPRSPSIASTTFSTHSSVTSQPRNPFPSRQSLHSNANHQSSPSSSDTPPSLPPLAITPSNDDFINLSQGSPSSEVNNNTSAIDEADMTRKLMDVESSFVASDTATTKRESYFVPEPGRWPHTRSVSPDRVERTQTYLKYAPERIHHRTESLNVGNTMAPANAAKDRSDDTQPKVVSSVQEEDADSQSSIPDQSFYTATTQAGSRPQTTTPSKPRAVGTGLSAHEDDDDVDELDEGGGSQSPHEMQDIPSSPIVAAAQRRGERMSASSPREHPLHDVEDDDNTPRQPQRSRMESGSFVDVDQNQSPPRLSRLQSRHSSQFSGLSAAPSISNFHDDSLEEDYALRPVGNRSSEFPAMTLRKPPSLGSIASSIHPRSPDRILKRPPALPADGRGNSYDDDSRNMSRPETPRMTNQGVRDLTDTVLAQHVRDVHVPDTIAKEYRANHLQADPRDSILALNTPQVGFRNTEMTLKEQNTKVDKLSKENFDLKLKIHFLDQALQNRSEEGVKELVSKNAQLQAELVKAKKENQILRKKIRELEALQRQQREQLDHADAVSVMRSSRSGSMEDFSAPSLQLTQIHEDATYYKDRAQLLETENEKLAQVWQSVLDEEVVRRTQVQKDLESTRFELARMKERHGPEMESLQQEISKLKDYRSPLRRLKLRRSRPNLKRGDTSDSQLSQQLSQTRTSQSVPEPPDSESMSGTTVVETLRQEVAELRQNLGAQTSMLASRNRERERLQGEIEDLKLVNRRGDGVRSIAGDSLPDRSVSRSQHRPLSRASGFSQLSDADRERYEALQARLRDENALLRMRNQDLQREVNALDDLRVEADTDIEQLSEAVKDLERQLQEKEQEIEDLLIELANHEKDGESFRHELQEISESFNRITDDREATQSTIESLQNDLSNANNELESMGKKLKEMNAAKERLEVEQESSQGEIAFLREEQEADKIKIGELQSAFEQIKGSQREEDSILREVEELGAQASRATEEARRLRKALSIKESEANASAEELQMLERNMREALGMWNGDRATLLARLSQMKRELDSAMVDLDSTKQDLAEREEEIAEREALLDASNLEIRRLTELINSERQARRIERAEAGKTGLGDHSALLAELEIARLQDRKKLAEIELTYTEQLKDRNNLLLALWTRLSSICGSAWAERHKISVADGTAPTLENIAHDLPAFYKTISLAVKHIEHNIGHFRTRLHSAEEQIWQDFKALDLALQDRAQRLQKLEYVVAERLRSRRKSVSGETPQTATANAADLARLKEENKALRRELKQIKHSSTSFTLPGLPSPTHTNTSDTRRPSLGDQHRSAAANQAASANATSPHSKRANVIQGPYSPPPKTSAGVSEPTSPATKGVHGGGPMVTNTGPITDGKININSQPPPPAWNPPTSISHFPTSSAMGTTTALGMGRSPYTRAPSFQRQTRSGATENNTHPSEYHQRYTANNGEVSESAALTTTNQNSTNSSSSAGGQLMPNNTKTHINSNSNDNNMQTQPSSSDVGWVLRLQEMQNRLQREREGRLLDRDGARVRLEEGRKEVENLRRELERVRARNNGGAPALGMGIAIGGRREEDVD